MKIKYNDLYLSVLLTIFFLFAGSTSISETDLFTTMAQSLREKTKENIALKCENQLLKTQVFELKTNLDDIQIANIPAEYFAKVGYFEKDNPFPRDPVYMRRIWEYCKKYRPLLTPEAETTAREAQIIPEYFVFFWPAKESHYNPFCFGKNKDKFGRTISHDVNLTQINMGTRKDPKTKLYYPTTDAWDFGFKQLPDELKARKGDPTIDPEIGIAMLYIWINERVRCKMAWAYLNDWTWLLYWKAKQVKNDLQGPVKPVNGGG